MLSWTATWAWNPRRTPHHRGKRDSFVYIFKTVQIIIVAIIASTVFLRTNMHTKNETDGALFVGALLFGMVNNMFNRFAEMAMTLKRLPVLYKHRDLRFHPAWTFTLPNFLLGIPISMLKSIAWVVITYYAIRFAPEASRFFKQLLLIFLIQQMAAGLFRLVSGVSRSEAVANTSGSLVLLLIVTLAGFSLRRGLIPSWWIWGYWISPLTYAFNALLVNKMLAPRWMNRLVRHSLSLSLSLSLYIYLSIYPSLSPALSHLLFSDNLSDCRRRVIDLLDWQYWITSMYSPRTTGTG